MWKAVSMTRDLGSGLGQVHRAEIAEAAREVLRFWLVETPPGKRFARDAALDAEIERRFGALHRSLSGEGAADWESDPRTLLAAVIVLDQFSRNLYRGSAAAFAQDDAARALTELALAKDWAVGLDATERQFLYLPLMHSERLADQERAVALFEANGDDFVADFARRHRDQIARFGRFPGRNAALGRTSTPVEAALLASGEGAF